MVNVSSAFCESALSKAENNSICGKREVRSLPKTNAIANDGIGIIPRLTLSAVIQKTRRQLVNKEMPRLAGGNATSRVCARCALALCVVRLRCALCMLIVFICNSSVCGLCGIIRRIQYSIFAFPSFPPKGAGIQHNRVAIIRKGNTRRCIPAFAPANAGADSRECWIPAPSARE